MHSSGELTSSSFEIEVDGVAAPLEELFEGFGEQDRLGVTRPCGRAGERPRPHRDLPRLLAVRAASKRPISASRGPRATSRRSWIRRHARGFGLRETTSVPMRSPPVPASWSHARQCVLAGRRDLVEDGVPIETYRRISLEEALGRLG
jgi:hypothetical protein